MIELFKSEGRLLDERMITVPWDMRDYPNSFKNLDPLVRKKAIDIANALLENDYPDDKAIPIAISQAKEWMENTSKEEKDLFEKEKNPTKKDQHDTSSSNPDLLDNDVEVFYENDSWVLQTKDAKKASDTFDKKSDAVERAKEIAENKESSVVRYTKKGEKQDE